MRGVRSERKNEREKEGESREDRIERRVIKTEERER